MPTDCSPASTCQMTQILLFSFVVIFASSINGQECPNSQYIIKHSLDLVTPLKPLHDAHCFMSDLLYFDREIPQPMRKALSNNEFNGITNVYVPPDYKGHFLIYNNVALNGNELRIWGMAEKELMRWTRFVRRYQVCFGSQNDGRDVPTSLVYEEHKLSEKAINNTCDVIHDSISFLITPCRVDNNWHLHNDVLLPTWIDVVESNSILSNENYNKNRQAFVYDGDLNQQNNAVTLFSVLWDMFDSNVYSYEDTLFNTIVCEF